MADEGIETDEAFGIGTSMDGAQNGGDMNVSNQTDDLDDPVSSCIYIISIIFSLVAIMIKTIQQCYQMNRGKFIE